MKKLLTYLVKNLIGDDVTVTENSQEDNVELLIKAPKDKIGLIIGKGGKTIKAIRNVLKVKATLEKKGVFVSIEEN